MRGLADWDRRRALAAMLGLPLAAAAPRSWAQAGAAIDRVKAGLVAVGSVQKTRSPPFQFRGTGFAVGDGSLIATNAHVVNGLVDGGASPEILVVVQPGVDGKPAQPRAATRVAIDADHDLALLKLESGTIPPLALAPDAYLRDGDRLLFTGFPIGTVLGVFPATHQAMISGVTPVAAPMAGSRELDAKTIRRLASGPFPIYQLDATAYPGNSGSPLYDPVTGAVAAVINMVFVKGTKESALSQPSGISYAIPVRHLRELLAGAR